MDDSGGQRDRYDRAEDRREKRAKQSTIRRLVAGGLKLDRGDLGDEGFQIITHEVAQQRLKLSKTRRFVTVTANSPVGLKHGCQELAYFQTSATVNLASIDWLLDIR